MKKIFLSAVLLVSLTSLGQQAGPNKQKKHKTEKPEQEYRPFKSAGAWFVISGTSLFIGSQVKLTANYLPKPVYDSTSMSLQSFNTRMDKYNKGQQNLNAVFYGGLIVSGISMIFGAFDLMNAEEKKIGDKMTLKYKAGPTGASVCLNF